MAYHVEVEDKLKAALQPVWNEVVKQSGASIFHTWEWLRAFEDAAPVKAVPCHILVYEDERLVGLSPVYQVDWCPMLDDHKLVLVDKPFEYDGPMLLSHTFYAYYGDIAALPTKADTVYPLVLHTLEDLARERDVLIYGFINVSERNVSLLSALRVAGFLTHYVSTTCKLTGCWSSFDDYLKSCCSASWRRRIRRHLAQAEKSQLCVKVGKGVPNVTVAHRLVLKVFEKWDWPYPDIYPQKYLEAILEWLEPYLHILTVSSKRGETVGTFWYLDHGETMTAWIAGLDYDFEGSHIVYDYAYWHCIEYAVRHNLREINMGRGTFRHKAHYGFQFEDLFISLATVHPDLRRSLLTWLSDLETFMRHMLEEDLGSESNNREG